MAEGGMGRATSQTESVPGHSSLYSRHSQNHVENMSMEICTIMTRLGYGEEMRRWRVEKHRELDRLKDTRSSHASQITAGSKAEGLTCYLESDWDMLHVFKGVLCVEAGINLHTIPDDIDVFRMDTRVYPGHCILLQKRPGITRFKQIHNSLCDNGYGAVLLSSSLFLDEYSALFTQSEVVDHERAGPSTPGTISGILHVDRVIALRCHCPSILQRWAARPRHWPSPFIVQKVVSLGAYLTPVGFKGSDYKHMEWRMCFNTGETELVNNLNSTQTQVYVMLKMIVKDVLKPCKKEVTSYVIKNIVLWQAENNPQHNFYKRSFLYWLHDGLRALKTAITTQQMSYYMVPERNLMAASGLQDKQQSKWVADITDMMDEGPNVILRLPKIRQAIVASPEPMLWFSKTRMELEMLFLEALNRQEKCTDGNGEVNESDAILHAIWRRYLKLLMEVVQRMHIGGSAVYDMLDVVSRIFS
ncbi:uncharacterized protein LOC127851186 [Dreissena polymorpha]|uniref:Uncharacterized protein n=1 Tax=Dreissena polymorpha TaxID=45954 RepID=A0A9D4CW14_DREPO|nr:uncharacterized protein LOC127851186 [Dreissena polymorpha]XP_052240776.1 uncharacterized protein LOC127851186 [Dreissena polymorpha]XP_052240777.1 uncharacterized protein LOC127851186 [Dreissena polymorpha]KAH3733084.1 hypothetical protein DPMN_039508 [Dreissena polymorpha]